MGRAKKMRDRVTALCKDVRTDSRLVVEQRTFVWIGGRRIHPRTEINEDSRVAFATLNHDRRRIGTESGGVNEVFSGKNADLRGPLERRECLVERQTDGVVVRDEAWRFPRALKEVRKRVGAILKGPDDARRCGHGHLRIITERYFNC